METSFMSFLRSLITAYVLALLLGPAPASAANADTSKVSFYFAAHEDDWQLFMNPAAFDDVSGAAGKTVFIHVTAGDDGLGAGSGGRKHPYYLARENGALAAIRFMADADATPINDQDGTIIFNGHKIFRVAYPTTISYFLRLPDGYPTGTGFPGTGFQSLKRLAAGEIDTMSAVDDSTSYHGWNDLVATVREIIGYERGQAPLIQLNVPDPNATINPGDHSDHLMTAKAALDAASNMGCVRRVYYVDYASAKLPPNLNGEQRDEKSAVFAVTLDGVFAFDHGTSWHYYDQSFIGRDYFRVEEPRGDCTAPGATVAAAAKH
jgi:hypothetical protein